MRRLYLPAAAALGLLAACQPQPISQADEDAIRASLAAFETAANSGNVDGMTAHYAADATIQPPGMLAATGTAAIHKLWTDLNAPVRVNVRISTQKIAGQGDVAYTTGTYHIVFTSKDSTQPSPPAEDGKFTDVYWRQADKSWKVVADNWNQNSMPTMAAAPARPARRH